MGLQQGPYPNVLGCIDAMSGAVQEKKSAQLPAVLAVCMAQACLHPSIASVSSRLRFAVHRESNSCLSGCAAEHSNQALSSHVGDHSSGETICDVLWVHYLGRCGS